MSSVDHDRRRNHELRERLNQLILLSRHLSRNRNELSADELENSQLRAEWLADEIWRAAALGPVEERLGSTT